MLPGPTPRYLPISVNNATGVTEHGPHSHAICQDDLGWMYNLAGMSPCLVSSGVLAACYGPSWDIPPLNRSNHYTPPDSTTVNDCSCSWSAYNLLSACTACQGFPESLLSWGLYKLKCPSQLLSNSFFPVTVSLNIPIPFWAATDPSTWPDQKFKVTTAHLLFNQEFPKS
ncbi:hypothetical protein BDZ94DRAFT_94189 [Collybia nuda]|uniref:Uncharacterized protein n=1 Tax=Collybia nuda TaxID=64659 RepID=A0A9P5YFM1_9AGAR|nr:hypothetical protein BDZ94DRAFT_94189 [Collybia nuda]